MYIKGFFSPLYISSVVWIAFDYLAVGSSVAVAIFGREIRQSHIAASASVEIKVKGCGGWAQPGRRMGTDRIKNVHLIPCQRQGFLHPFFLYSGAIHGIFLCSLGTHPGPSNSISDSSKAYSKDLNSQIYLRVPLNSIFESKTTKSLKLC